MLHPFADEELETPARPAVSTVREQDFDITSRDVKDHRVFLKTVEGVLRPHWSTVEVLRDRLRSPTLPPEVKSVVATQADRFDSALSTIQKNFRVYVETSAEESLEKEASRLERRYFDSTQNRLQIQFLKLKRLYEKIRTFNELAKREWREVQKILDTLAVIKTTRQIAVTIEKEYLRNLTLLMRQTDSFLDELKLYLKTENENVDQITGSYKIQVSFDPTLRYTIAGALGLPEQDASTSTPIATPKAAEATVDLGNRDLHGSVAYNIVIETREHKLNRASIIQVPLLGSRDWNRSPHYSLEVPIKFFEECVAQLRLAYHVNVDEDEILHGGLATPAAVVRRGQGEHSIMQYHELVTEILEDAAIRILIDDFPGVERPEVFLYHCGPNVMYRILLSSLRQRRLGDMYYLDDNNNTIREYPEEFLKKVLIDWWNQRFANVSGEDVDSYLTYSRQLEMVKREYRILYEEGVSLRRRENPGVGYLGVEKWLKENRLRVFGLRKAEIFRRFVSGTVLE